MNKKIMQIFNNSIELKGGILNEKSKEWINTA